MACQQALGFEERGTVRNYYPRLRNADCTEMCLDLLPQG